MKHCAYVFALNPLFNKKSMEIFGNFDEENTVLLNKALLTNYFELLSGQNLYKKIFVLSKEDEDCFPEELKENGAEIIFADTSDGKIFLKKLNEKYFEDCHNNLVLFYNSIGIKKDDIAGAFNFLDMEDETFVIGKSSNNNSAFIGFNNFNAELFASINWQHLDFDQILFSACKHENFVHIMSNNFMSINSIKDFKNLYGELSKKESLSYCSQNIHEQFTHLFIEYKDLLK